MKVRAVSLQWSMTEDADSGGAASSVPAPNLRAFTRVR
jgi:hypothetical protein